jgi:chaperone required for assembly of F1-ATPase
MIMIDDQEKLERLARDNYERPLPKRFYKIVEVTDDLGIALDGRKVKTPLKAPLVMPTRALAEAVAEEWRAQEKVIHPGIMPLTRYANTAIDRATSERANIIAEMVSYANSDLVCYRAEAPSDLVALQAASWDPAIAWAKQKFGHMPMFTTGVVHQAQSPEFLAAVKARIETLNAHDLTGLYNLATLTGSVLISLMLLEGALTDEQGWKATHVDEDFQISTWGEDWEAAKRRAGRLVDYSACLQFLTLSRGAPNSAISAT